MISGLEHAPCGQFQCTLQNGVLQIYNGPLLVEMVMCYTTYRWKRRPHGGRQFARENDPGIAARLSPRTEKKLFKKAKEEIDTARSSIKSALLLSAIAIVISYAALMIALSGKNG